MPCSYLPLLLGRLVQASSRWRNPMAAPSKLRLTLMHPTAMFPAGAIRQQMSGYHLLIRYYPRLRSLDF